MKSFLNWLLARLKEKTTWVAILTTLGTVFGVVIKPELQEIITTVGLGITSLVLFFTKENK